MIELWRDAPGYEDIYQCSTLGRLQNLNTKKIRNPWINKRGYRMVVIRADGVNTKWYIHRLINLTWNKKETEDHNETHHIDGNKLNNRADNLIWVTPLQHKQLHRK